MDEPLTVKISVKNVAKNTYEITGIVRGKFYKRQYIGYTEQTAINRFEEWLGTQI